MQLPDREAPDAVLLLCDGSVRQSASALIQRLGLSVAHRWSKRVTVVVCAPNRQMLDEPARTRLSKLMNRGLKALDLDQLVDGTIVDKACSHPRSLEVTAAHRELRKSTSAGHSDSSVDGTEQPERRLSHLWLAESTLNPICQPEGSSSTSTGLPESSMMRADDSFRSTRLPEMSPGLPESSFGTKAPMRFPDEGSFRSTGHQDSSLRSTGQPENSFGTSTTLRLPDELSFRSTGLPESSFTSAGQPERSCRSSVPPESGCKGSWLRHSSNNSMASSDSAISAGRVRQVGFNRRSSSSDNLFPEETLPRVDKAVQEVPITANMSRALAKFEMKNGVWSPSVLAQWSNLTFSECHVTQSFELWNTLHHHNVARLIGRSSVGLKPVLVLEHLPLTLDEWLLGSVGAGSPSNAQVAQIVLGIASALSYMHALNVMHRNVRPACVYLDANLEAKLGDLDVAKVAYGLEE
ncbi:MAG: hypothetical protein SGPRY_012898, partial [Prymnesium sp.]